MKENLDTMEHFDRRPWGSFTVIDEGEGFKVKRIEVLPGKRLSYQRHSSAPNIGSWYREQQRLRSTVKS